MSTTRRHRLNHPLVYRIGLSLIRRFPRGFNRWWIRRVADFNYARLPGVRRALEANLAPVLGDDEDMLRRASRSTVRNYAEYLVDYGVYFSRPGVPTETAFRRTEGYSHVLEAMEAGNGVVIITAHIGFWELGGLFFRQQSLPVTVLTAEDPDAGVHAERSRIRTALGIETITVGGDPWNGLAVARALRANRLVAMLVDRYQGPDAIPVHILGRTALFAPGPVLFARMTGAAVIPAFVPADGEGTYTGLILPPVAMNFTGDRTRDLNENTQRIANVIEPVIRRYPTQWYNFEPIWGQ